MAEKRVAQKMMLGRMKRRILIGVLVVSVASCFWFWNWVRFRTSWKTFESQFPTVDAGDFHLVEQSSTRHDPCPFSMRSQIRLVIDHILHMQPELETGFSSLPIVYTLETGQSHRRVQCVVHYCQGKVLRIVVLHGPEAKQEAKALCDALRHTFPMEDVSLYEASLVSIHSMGGSS